VARFNRAFTLSRIPPKRIVTRRGTPLMNWQGPEKASPPLAGREDHSDPSERRLRFRAGTGNAPRFPRPRGTVPCRLAGPETAEGQRPTRRARSARLRAVEHSKDESVRGNAHTNTVEGFFSIFKRGMKCVYQHCGKHHLHRYVAEFDFATATAFRAAWMARCGLMWL
jgi:hypothetical protein